VNGGEDLQIVPNVRYNLDFAVGTHGLYFIPNEESARGTIRFYDFRTGRSHDVLAMNEVLSWAVSLSPDERFLVFAGYNQQQGDLMLVENFR
jgi:hypothetical protein